MFTFHIGHVITKSSGSSIKEVVHGISSINHPAIWDVGKTEAEKATIIKEIAKGKTTKSIAERINRHAVTVTRFLQNPSKRKPPSDRGVRKSVSKRDMYRLRRNLRKMPGATSERKTTGNRILGKLDSIKTMIKRSSLTPRHKRLRMEWSRKYTRTDMKFLLFTDESRASLDGPDGWAKGCVFNGDNCPNRMKRQQRGGGVMVWGGIIGNAIIGP
ncbi:Transposable element Tc3 transposase [Paramuricea clavata]|uniref:Transposable element Tc3 transposase n=1 Tax=Paramuricea clavata TaxID=317549 RepID=A0A6S7FN29_PARCT|nr:Transposable element Tc3 transposase [Paramuricea clavata]